MQCQYLGSRSPIARAWHLLRCVECRAARSVDATIARGLERLSSEPAPSEGLAQALSQFGAAPAERLRRPLGWRGAMRSRLPATGMARC